MGFLQKLLSDIVTVGKIFLGFEPIIAATAPGAATPLTVAANDVTSIMNAVVQVEQAAAALTPAPGAPALTDQQKIAMLVPLVGQILQASNAIAGKTIADPAGFQAGVAEIAAGAYAIVNSFHTDVVSQVTATSVKVKT